MFVAAAAPAKAILDSLPPGPSALRDFLTQIIAAAPAPEAKAGD